MSNNFKGPGEKIERQYSKSYKTQGLGLDWLFESQNPKWWPLESYLTSMYLICEMGYKDIS